MTTLLTQDVVPPSQSYRVIPLTQGQVAIVDEADFDWLNQSKWYAKWSPNTKSFYAYRHLNRREIPMHSFILKPVKRRIADHWNGDTLDNRRVNLRSVTHQQNMMNRKRPVNNTSGCIGVHRNKTTGHWCVDINYRGKPCRVGTFVNLKDAIDARRSAEAEVFGDFCRSSAPKRVDAIQVLALLLQAPDRRVLGLPSSVPQ